MALIAPLICRYVVVGTLHGQDCLNIFDIRIESPGEFQTRNEFIVDIAGDLLNQWNDHVLPLLTTAYTAVEVRYLDLDNAEGIAGSRNETDGSTWPAEGETTGAPMPNNVCAVMTKVLENRTRLQRNGRTSVGGLIESYTETADGNLLGTAFQADINDAFESLKDGINGGGVGSAVNMVVVHTVAEDYEGYSEIASFVAKPRVGTMRRRMVGYGQ